MTVSANRLGDMMSEQAFVVQELNRPTSAEVVRKDGQGAWVKVPSFDNGVHTFGPVLAPSAVALNAGDGVLIVSDEVGTLWLIGWTS